MIARTIVRTIARMSVAVRTLILVVLAALLLAMAVVFLGLYNVSARSGHLPFVDDVLHTSYENSVRLRAPEASEVPVLEDDSLVRLGARHYQQACSVCHGEPGRRRSSIARAMLPTPPPIGEAVAGWQAEHLFWIVRNGVKMSGMPHWPTQVRDDDVWPVVAFLAGVHELAPEDYQALTTHHEESMDQVPGKRGTEVEAALGIARRHGCVGCHGLTGRSDNRHVPNLNRLNAGYIEASLTAYREQKRHSGIMQQATSKLDDDEIEVLAKYYAAVGPAGAAENHAQREAGFGIPASWNANDTLSLAAAIARGEDLANGRIPGKALDIPVCSACHGPWEQALSHDYPPLSSQPASFLFRQLVLWKAGKRGGTPLARMMHKVVPELDEAQMRDLSIYYAQLSADTCAGEACR